MHDRSVSVWEKFDFERYRKDRQAASAPLANAQDDSAPVDNRKKRIRERLFWLVLNVVACVYWIYVPIKLFGGDLDRWLVAEVSPSLVWVIDYRFFFILTIFAIVVLVLRRWKLAGALCFVLCYPLVVLFWKLPRIYYRTQNWNLVIGTFQVLWSLVKSFRFGLAALTVFTLATLGIVMVAPKEVLWCAALALVGLWLVLLVRAVKYAIFPSTFVVHQKKIISTVLENEEAWEHIASLPPDTKRAEVTQLTKDQIEAVFTKALMGLTVYGVSSLWAEKLDEYRKSGASVAFSALAVVALIAQAIVIFTLVNVAIYRIDQTQFEYDASPHLMTFIRYAFASLYANEIEALRPKGVAAGALTVTAAFSCAVIVLVLILSIVFSLKQGKDDRVAEESIREMREKADSFAAKLSGEYGLPLAELIERILSLGGFFASWLQRIHTIADAVKGQAPDVIHNPR